jgi:hypothetical protein
VVAAAVLLLLFISNFWESGYLKTQEREKVLLTVKLRISVLN